MASLREILCEYPIKISIPDNTRWTWYLIKKPDTQPDPTQNIFSIPELELTLSWKPYPSDPGFYPYFWGNTLGLKWNHYLRLQLIWVREALKNNWFYLVDMIVPNLWTHPPTPRKIEICYTKVIFCHEFIINFWLGSQRKVGSPKYAILLRFHVSTKGFLLL